MFEALFGAELPLAVRFLVAFLIVLILIVATFWGIRRVGGAQLGGGMIRGRQPRLAVIETAAVYGRRSLVLIRRDNVEHLLMIGGPADVVIEQNIMRAVPVTAPREVTAPRAPGMAEAMAKAPVIAAPPARAEDHQREHAIRAEPLPRPEPLAGSEPPMRPERRPESVPRAPGLADSKGHQAEQLPRRASEGAIPVLLRPAQPLAPVPRAPAEPLPMPDARPAPAATEAELNDMAQRLEAVLRRPMPAAQERGEPVAKPPPLPESPPPSPAPVFTPPAAREPARAEPARTPAANSAAPEQAKPGPEPAKPAPEPASDEAAPAEDVVPALRPEPTQPSSKSVFDSLEQEMASLLGRPAGKE